MNGVLDALSHADLAFLCPHLQTVEVTERQIIEQATEPIQHVYFLEGGLAAIVAASGKERIALGLIGFEGASGVSVFLGTDRSPHSTIMLTAGAAQRISADSVRTAMAERPELKQVLLNYGLAFYNQVAHTAMSNASSSVEQRVARWLLMASDRFSGDRVPVTHDTIAFMLNVRRAGVSTGLLSLQKQMLIETERGWLRIIDRAALKKLVGGFYGLPEKEYVRLLGRKSRILVVDDDGAFAYAVERYLTANGYRVFTALSSRAAFKAMRESRFDVIVTDVKLGPGEPDGLALASQVNHEHPGLPIICVTAYPERVRAMPAPQLVRVFPKPVSLAALRQAVDEQVAGLG